MKPHNEEIILDKLRSHVAARAARTDVGPHVDAVPNWNAVPHSDVAPHVDAVSNWNAVPHSDVAPHDDVEQ